MKQYRSMPVWVGLILVVVVMFSSWSGGAAGSEITFTEFITKSTSTKDVSEADRIDEFQRARPPDHRLYPRGQAVSLHGRYQDVPERSHRQRRKDHLRARGRQRVPSRCLTWLPMLLLLGLFFFFMRQLQSGGPAGDELWQVQGQDDDRSEQQGDV